MPAPDLIAVAVQSLGRDPGSDPVRAAIDALRDDPAKARVLVDALLPVLAKVSSDVEAGRISLVLGAAYLAKDPRQAKEMLVQALGLLGDKATPGDLARGQLRFAQAELALGDSKAGRAALVRALPSVLEQDDDALARDLAGALRQSGEEAAAIAVDRLARERREHSSGGAREERLAIIARLVHVLNSSLAATAEPLYAILRAAMEETGAERGYVMLYEGAALRFERGLARSGRALSPAEFAFSTTIVDRALNQGECVLVEDLGGALPYAQATSARELGLRSALCAPLRVDRKRAGAASGGVALPSVKGIAGVLYLDATSANAFGRADVTFAELLADCAVLAVRASRTAAALEARPAVPPRRSGKNVPEIEPPADEKLPRSAEHVPTRDAGMRSVLATVDRVAASAANVLVRGESGTGKELVARSIHRLSPRGKNQFIAVDCGAIPDELIASELFGHEPGAFTGATEPRAGLLEKASGGTLFLDEVGEASPNLQASLLRALQEGEVRRLGSDRTRPIDVRIVAATHRDLRALVERGEFRQDLLFRLAVVEVKLPPLRERPGDVTFLANRFLGERNRAIEAAALDRLEEHAWPGNVRELENVLEAACVLAPGTVTLSAIDHLLASSATAPVSAPLPAAPRAVREGEGTLEELERRAIEERLERFGWNQVQAAKSLGVDRNTLRRKILRYGIVRGGR